MLSYRHGFHAGNHADLLKHLTLIALLHHFSRKEAGFCYLDSHSGKGFYDLRDGMGQKNAEFESGIGRLWHSETEEPLLRSWLDLIRRSNPDGKLRYYPGSPAIASALCREQDKLLLMEMHNGEFELLKQNFRHDRRVHLHHRDGFEGLAALVPPTPRRGFVLIDPAYEVKADYETVLNCLSRIYQRWEQAVVAIWFPLLGLQKDRGEWLKDRFRRSGFSKVWLAELRVKAQAAEGGMHGSGMIIVNTPWQLDETLRRSLKAAAEGLGLEPAAALTMEWLKAPRAED